ncbi:MAG: DNA methyltransferase [Candidatus Methylumidiphilus sp.]
MPAPNPAETRFAELMAELFQLDEAEALDFGLYRIIRRHNQEVRAFLGTVTPDKNGKTLTGGQLSALMDAAFTVADEETKADGQWRSKQLEEQLSIKPGMTATERAAQLDILEKVPATAPHVREYRRLAALQADAASVHSDRAEVLNRLYQFFARHYQDGDFIVERRYGRGGARYIKSTGEDTEFHWATEDMYYIKSGDIFTDYPVKLANGRALIFSVEPQSLQATRAALKPNDKAHYELHTLTPTPLPAGEGLIVRLQYLKGAGSDKHKDAIAEAIHAQTGGDVADIKRWLNRYIARNQADFFIHKRLKEALTEDLDIFIKTEVLNAEQLLAEGDLPKRLIKTARLVRHIGRAIIDFLAALEDFQKALWEKKKLVFATRYVITLDRIEKLAGADWLETRLDAIIKAQRPEWQALGLGDYPHAAAVQRGGQTDLLSTGPRYLPLPVDTGHFDEAFKWDLLDAVTRENGLDEVLDGVAIHSDNWQALNTLTPKYRETIKCIYIDPPYNTGGDGFPYKDAYPHASWLAMMGERLGLAAPFLRQTGALFASIDHVERNALTEALAQAFGRKNRVEEIIWGQNTTKNQSPTYSTNHEYIEVYARDLAAASAEERMFREPKPGAAELLELVEKLNPDYPSSVEVERQIKILFEQHRAAFRAELEETGIEYDKSLDSWKGLYNYQHAEYRDEAGRYVADNQARIAQGKIWVWREDNPSMPSGKQAETTNDQKNNNYRFYQPLHPFTNKPCPHPKRGWCWPKKADETSPSRPSFESVNHDFRIVWGNDHKKVPQLKKFLHEVDTQVSKSFILDYTDGEKELTLLTGKVNSFSNPKPTTLIERFILQTTDAEEWVMDFFAGSGTTFHAAISARHDDRHRRRVLLIEGGPHFEPVLLPRIKRVSSAWAWKDGKPLVLNGPGLFLRVQTLEQYEDTLENLGQDADAGQQELSFDDPAFQLRYRLNRASRKLYAGIDRFTAPFGYQLKRVENGETPAQNVDLIESLVYLLGLNVQRLYREPAGVILTGRNRRGQSVLVLFRDCAIADSADWLQAKRLRHPAEKLYTNDPATLTFEGCDQFEAIETVFALQFGRE